MNVAENMLFIPRAFAVYKTNNLTTNTRATYFHQYTLKIKDGRRNELATYLAKKELQTVVNYPLPVYKQNAYQQELHLKTLKSYAGRFYRYPFFRINRTRNNVYLHKY